MMQKYKKNIHGYSTGFLHSFSAKFTHFLTLWTNRQQAYKLFYV